LTQVVAYQAVTNH